MKKVLGLLTLLAIVLTLVACGGQAVQTETQVNKPEEEVLTLNLSHSMALGNNVTLGYEKFKELLEEKSNGNIVVNLYPASQYKSDIPAMQDVVAGKIEMASSSTPNMADISKDFMALDLPYITSSANQKKLYEALDNGELGKKLEEVSKKAGLKPIMWSEYGYRNFVSSEKPIKKPSDMKGMKVRVTASEVEKAVVEALGAEAVKLAWPDVRAALMNKEIDSEGNTFDLLYSASHQDGIKYAATTEHNYSMHVLMMNYEMWEGLSEENKALIKEAAKEALEYQRGITKDMEKEANTKFKEAGIEVVELTPKELGEWKDATKGIEEKFEDVLDKELVAELKKIK